MGTPKGCAELAVSKNPRGKGEFQQFAIPQSLKGSARLRITVTASHEEDQIRACCEAIKRNCRCSHGAVSPCRAESDEIQPR